MTLEILHLTFSSELPQLEFSCLKVFMKEGQSFKCQKHSFTNLFALLGVLLIICIQLLMSLNLRYDGHKKRACKGNVYSCWPTCTRTRQLIVSCLKVALSETFCPKTGD